GPARTARDRGAALRRELAGHVSDPGVEQLWERYRRSGDPEARSAILGGLLGVVHHVARQIAGRVGDAVDYEDLVGAGSLGLVQAIGGFDPSRGVAFVTYATNRVRGAILDELRAADWRPRSVRERARRIGTATRELRDQLDREPTVDEVAASLEIDQETYWRWRGDAEVRAIIPLDSALAQEDGEGIALGERIPDEETPLPGMALEQDEQKRLLREAIAELPEQQRTVLALNCYEGLSHRQIAEVLHVTESRVSQIRSAAIRSLRAAMVER
ncbi:MAG TPA: FliA/WhiG family RNA polymerase sigma factor, partial [Gemmatimonadales bacterium]|nr:FliA/WhiG family RNA polymerase sigma factor [Gemmatimonadales bacterium]